MQRADFATKHARVIELRVAGWTHEAIAAELGYADKSGVRYVLSTWVDDHAPTQDSIVELRQHMLAQLDQLHAAHWPQAVGARDPGTGEWVREPSEKSSELLLKIAGDSRNRPAIPRSVTRPLSDKSCVLALSQTGDERQIDAVSDGAHGAPIVVRSAVVLQPARSLV